MFLTSSYVFSGFQNQAGSSLLFAFSAVCNAFLRFTFGVTPADCQHGDQAFLIQVLRHAQACVVQDRVLDTSFLMHAHCKK